MEQDLDISTVYMCAGALGGSEVSHVTVHMGFVAARPCPLSPSVASASVEHYGTISLARSYKN